jgi:hypothetical protein
MLYQVTSNTGSLRRIQTAPLARLLAFVLLAFVSYAATAESVHRHGGILLVSQVCSAPAIASSDETASSVNDDRVTADCLICQLRQQLSFSLLNAPSLNVIPQAQIARFSAAALFSFSGTAAPKRGRAPPCASPA